MAETVQILRVQVTIKMLITGDDGKQQAVDWTYDKPFTDGTGTDQVGTAFYDASRSLATTSEDLDLAGTLTDFQGATIAMNNVKVYVMENLDTDTGDYLLLKQGSSNPVTTILAGTSPTLRCGPGGLILLVNPIDGYAVSAGSADTLAVESVDSSSYKILIAGDNA